jgi:hypothetical protein
MPAAYCGSSYSVSLTTEIHQIESCQAMSDIEIKKTLTIYCPGFKHGITIPPQHIKEEGGETFMHMANHLTHTYGLLTGKTTTSTRTMARMDVLQQILALRNEKLVWLTAACGGQGPHAKKPKLMDVKVGLPSTVLINAPTIGDIEGMPMKLLLSWKQTAPLYIAMTTDNIKYMSEACKWQLENLNIKRGRDEKKQIGDDDCTLDDENTGSQVLSEADNDEPQPVSDIESDTNDALDANGATELSFDDAMAAVLPVAPETPSLITDFFARKH